MTSGSQVTVLWGADVLDVIHVARGRAFHVGEVQSDYSIPLEMLGAERALLVTREGAVAVPACATGWAETRDGTTHIDLPGGLAFEVTARGPVESFPAARVERAPWLSTGASLVLHALVLVALSLAVGGRDEISVQRNRLETLHRLSASADRRVTHGDDVENGTGETAAQPSGAMGSPASTPANARYADPHAARLAALDEAAKFGMITLLSDAEADPNAPTGPWAADPTSADGTMWGDAIGDALGRGGLGLGGAGQGGGGRGEGIGLGTIGTVGHGSGQRDGEGFGCGCGNGMIGGAHVTRAPVIRCAPARDGSGGCVATVSGRLPPETIQRIVRRNFGRVRACYEDGLRTNPALEGRVAVKFVIARDGSVSTAQDGGSDLASESVRQCVVRAFGEMSFPEPEGGIVTVVYPVALSPGA